ncbi:hypothetical protein KCG43_20045 [Photobacterium sp. WH24]|uniref:hypothetical protein n=1 Tax=Photobacterium sp. WH24 TaxID=2827237 RepID=UPI001C43F77F|nr:hypothetical protein [Photobacterium sp. WH24]MBV7264306.1 hypothetical protein [Photobacterium sp. WH24]
MSRLSLVVHLASSNARQVLFVGAKSTQKTPFCSLVWSGAVVGAPGADNLKIRPEFFPGGEASIKLLISALKVQSETQLNYL